MIPSTLPILILAAGASRRMRGRDKLMEPIDGTPLLRLQAQKACLATDGPVIITLPVPPHARYDALVDLPVQSLPVPDAHKGMSASLRTGILALPPGTKTVMVLLGDLPDITARDINIVAQAVDFASNTLIWRGATQTGAPGHPTVFHADLFKDIAELTGDTGGRELMELAKGRIALVPLSGNRARCDLDTPEDWAAWREDQKTAGENK